MKNCCRIAFLFGFTLAAHAAPNQTGGTNTTAHATNSVPEIPKSVFVIPANPKEGRDPFYPNSTSMYAVPSLANHSNSLSAPIELLTLKSLSPTLAQINRTLLAVGEESDIEVQGGRIHVRLVQIKPESVLVEVGGRQYELHLRPGA